MRLGSAPHARSPPASPAHWFGPCGPALSWNAVSAIALIRDRHRAGATATARYAPPPAPVWGLDEPIDLKTRNSIPIYVTVHRTSDVARGVRGLWKLERVFVCCGPRLPPPASRPPLRRATRAPHVHASPLRALASRVCTYTLPTTPQRGDAQAAFSAFFSSRRMPKAAFITCDAYGSPKACATRVRCGAAAGGCAGLAPAAGR